MKIEQGIPSARIILAGLIATYLAFPWAAEAASSQESNRPGTANQVQLLSTGHQSFARIMEGIRTSEKSVDAMYYLWYPCDVSSRLIIDAMAEKKKANPEFRARILLDAFSTKPIDMSLMTEALRKKGLEIRYFMKDHADRFKPQALANVRNHAKVITFDATSFVSGGRNVADEYFAINPHFNWVDKDVFVRGPEAQVADADFETWWRVSTEHATKPSQQALQKFESECINVRDHDRTVLSAVPERLLELNNRLPVLSCPDVKLVVDPPNGPRVDGTSGIAVVHQILRDITPSTKPSSLMHVKLMEKAQVRVVVENFSYLPKGTMRESFSKSLEKNVPIWLVTNQFSDQLAPAEGLGSLRNAELLTSMRRSRGLEGDSTQNQNPDGTPSASDGSTTRRTFSQKAVEYLTKFESHALSARARVHMSFFERAGSHIFGDHEIRHGLEKWLPFSGNSRWAVHSKALAIDGKSAIVSSFNLDPRSYDINYESAVLVENCPQFSRQLENEILFKVTTEDTAHLNSVLGPPAETPSPTTRDYWRQKGYHFLYWMFEDLL